MAGGRDLSKSQRAKCNFINTDIASHPQSLHPHLSPKYQGTGYTVLHSLRKYCALPFPNQSYLRRCGLGGSSATCMSLLCGTHVIILCLVFVHRLHLPSHHCHLRTHRLMHAVNIGNRVAAMSVEFFILPFTLSPFSLAMQKDIVRCAGTLSLRKIG